MTSHALVRSSKVALSLALLVAALGGCSPQKASGARSVPDDGTPQSVTVTVNPSTQTVYSGQGYTFTASVTGTTNQVVDWSLAEGAAAGSIGMDGSYVATAGTGTFHVLAASRAAPAVVGTATVVVETPPSTGVPMTTAHRTTGVAPLAVFFDAVDDVAATTPNRTWAWTSGVFQPADKEGTLYAWNFGDPGSGTWSTTSRSKNTATGYTAAHVFESPGVYVVTLVQTDPSGMVRTYTQQITVTAFSGTTYYVAANGSDANNGTSEATPWATVNKAMTQALAASGPVRVLFRRGDTFNITAAYLIEKPGPGIVGAYGTGNRPIMNVPGLVDYGIFAPYAPDGPGTGYDPLPTGGNDWRFMDLDFRRTGTGGVGAVGPPPWRQARDLLILRCRGQDFQDGAFGWADAPEIDPYPHTDTFIVDSESTAPNGVYGAFVGGRRLAVLGNNIHDIGQSHVLRVWQAYKGVVSNNRLWNSGPTRHALKMHSTVYGDGRAATRWVTVSDNLLRGKTWSATIGAQDTGSDERPSHIVFERNRFWAEQSVQVDLLVHESSDLMIRNNVFDARGAASGYIGIEITNLGGVLSPGSRARVLNNTITRLEPSNEFSGVYVGGGFTNVTVRNNLCAPGGSTTPQCVENAGAGSGFVSNTNVLTTSPGFTDGAAGDFTVNGTPAVDAGATLTDVHDDFLGAARPKGNGYDLGAYESH